jgi:hypothetical protein
MFVNVWRVSVCASVSSVRWFGTAAVVACCMALVRSWAAMVSCSVGVKMGVRKLCVKNWTVSTVVLRPVVALMACMQRYQREVDGVQKLQICRWRSSCVQ